MWSQFNLSTLSELTIVFRRFHERGGLRLILGSNPKVEGITNFVIACGQLRLSLELETTTRSHLHNQGKGLLHNE